MSDTFPADLACSLIGANAPTRGRIWDFQVVPHGTANYNLRQNWTFQMGSPCGRIRELLAAHALAGFTGQDADCERSFG